MNKPLITPDFALEGNASKRLYHDYAADMPIIDYHCHLPPEDVATDKKFDDMAAIWLAGDHYKWRAMRSNGIAERFCTGNASPWEKFEKWAATVPYTLRNPLYHWTHLELDRPFGINDRVLNPQTAKGIWEECNAMLQTPELSARGIMKQMDVRLVCTTDDPIDSLEHHIAVANDSSFNVQMRPTFRPDKAMAIEQPAVYRAYVEQLETAADMPIKSFEDLICALQKRHDYFHDNGCRLADHGLSTAYGDTATASELEAIFTATMDGKEPDEVSVRKFKAALLYECGKMHHARSWTMQLHFGALRNNSSRAFANLGPDTGFDSIGDEPVAAALSAMLDRLDCEEKLPKTIIYNLNPRDNAVYATMIGNFQDGKTPGKIQYGSGWWFLDQRDGMKQQIESLSQLGLLSRSVGMLTDSRSLLSYPRHDYFRRILCSIIGQDIDNGYIPADFDLVGNMVRDISYNNAATYFGFDGIKPQ